MPLGLKKSDAGLQRTHLHILGLGINDNLHYGHMLIMIIRLETIHVKLLSLRIDATDDSSLKKILTHNMNEEKEHVAMLMEWIRENDPGQDKMFEEHD